MLKLKSYSLLFLWAFAMILYSFDSKSRETLSVNIHDTYYVMSMNDFYKFCSVSFLGIALVYLLFDLVKIKLYSVLNVIHIYGMLLLFPLAIYLNYKNSSVSKALNLNELLSAVDYNIYLIITLMAIIFLQLLFIINIFASMIKQLSSSAT